MRVILSDVWSVRPLLTIVIRSLSSFSVGTSIEGESESEISDDDSFHQVDMDSDLEPRFSSDGESADEFDYEDDFEGNVSLATKIIKSGSLLTRVYIHV